MFFFTEVISTVTNFATQHSEAIKDALKDYVMPFGVLVFTVVAANATRNSTLTAQASLAHTLKTSLRDDFTSRYTILLEQHREQLNVVKEYLDSEDGKNLLNTLVTATNHYQAFKMLSGHRVISPYMRVLYHLLRHIYYNYYVENAPVEGKKQYASLVRSLIGNDVLFLVAVNSSYIVEDGKENDYAKYHFLLKEFDFFEHALFFSANEDVSGLKENEPENSFNNVKSTLIENYKGVITKECMPICIPAAAFRLPFIISCIFDNPLRKKSLNYINNLNKHFTAEFNSTLENYIEGNKKQAEASFSLSDYYGRVYITASEEHARSLTAVSCIAEEQYKSYPVVDDIYIERVLNILRKEINDPILNNYFLRRYNNNGQFSIKTPSDFIPTCRSLLAWEVHIDKLRGGEICHSYRQAEILHWQKFRAAVLAQKIHRK